MKRGVSRSVPFWIALLAAALCADPEEERDFRRVAEARDAARAAQGDAFLLRAREYLDRHPSGSSASVVRLWLGDYLRDTDPRAAADAYRASREASAPERLAAIRFRHEAPPPLEAERWVGAPPESAEGVRLLAFFSLTHPQTGRVLARLTELHQSWAARGLQVVGVAAVVDDHENQRPEALAERLAKQALPFPVAIDRQARTGPSRSLALYRGNRLPWAVVIDRYGRIAWIDAFAAQGNASAQIDCRVRALVEQPGYAALARRLREGDEEALRTLRALRTLEAADALFEGCEGPRREDAAEALRALLPEGFLGDDVAQAAARWRAERDRWRYSFDADRLVRR